MWAPVPIYFRKRYRGVFVSFGQWIAELDNLVWGPWLLGLLLGTGVYLSIRLRWLPVRRLKRALDYAVGVEEGGRGNEGVGRNRAGNGGRAEEVPVKGRREADGTVRGGRKAGRRKAGRVSSFSSLTTELAATIGTGNIVGVATAMVLGGPGALFWMVLTSVIGMATKLVESTLAVKYRGRNRAGQVAGGPMYVMEHAFPNRRVGHILAVAFAFFAVLASFGMGNMVQANSISDALAVTFQVPKAECGLVLTIVTVLVVLGGISVIGKVTQVMVPFMGIFYLLGTLAVILFHWKNVPLAVGGIFSAAFCPEAVSGGLFGQVVVSTFDSLRWGVSRGIFSNEAGLGASGISAAAADTEDPVRQGYVSMTGVFLDTIVICSATGLALAASGALGAVDEKGVPLTGTALTLAAFETVLGKFGGQFIGICIVLFAFATIVAWAYQGERAFEFLMRGRTKYNLWYRFAYGLAAFVGCLCPLEAVWNFSDICNGLMAVPNLICVLTLSRVVCGDIVAHDGMRGGMSGKGETGVELRRG